MKGRREQGGRERRAALTLVLLACAACERVPQPGSSAVPPSSAVGAAQGFDAGPVRTADEYLAQEEFRSADLKRGELLGLACLACHTLGDGQATLVGPNLHGVFGRAAASVEGFEYSSALKGSGLVWTPVSLERWLAEPATFVAGTSMAFAGYRSSQDRRDLIAFLLNATK